MGSILVIALGMFHAYLAIEVAIRTPRVAAFAYMWFHWMLTALWAVIFLGVGIAIGLVRRWARPVLLGVIAAYITVNISQALVDIRLGQGYMFWSGGLEADAAHIVSLLLAALIFIWFCTPQIDGAFTAANANMSALAELPLALSSWAVGCVAYCLFTLIQMDFFLWRDVGTRVMMPRYLVLTLIIGLGGALTLCHKRYGLIAASLCLLVYSMQTMIALAAPIILTRHPVDRGGAPDLFLANISLARSSLTLAAALFGFYAARFVKRPWAHDPSVQMQDHLR